MKDNWLNHSLTLLSQDASVQKKYVHSFFKNEAYNNAAELLVEFEDAIFMIRHYLKKKKM